MAARITMTQAQLEALINEHTNYHYLLTFYELAQLVVDSLLHALQDLRYIWSLHREEQVVVEHGSWMPC